MSQAVVTPLTVTRVDGTTFQVTPFRLLQFRSAISLELKGIKHSRGDVGRYAFEMFFGVSPKRMTKTLRLAALTTCNDLLNDILPS